MSEESIRKRPGSSEGLPSSPVNWLAVGAVVYGWSDRRDAAIDRAWWRTAGARLHAAWVKLPAVTRPAEERASLPEELV